MRILITADPILPVPPTLYGGIERIIASLVERLIERGHEVALLAHHESTCAATAKFAWPTGTNPLSHVVALRRAVRTFQPQLVHSFSRLLYMGALLANHRLPKIMSYQREPTPRTVRWANRLARGSLTFTGCSNYISGKGRAIGGMWHTIHNFVDLDLYTFQESVSPEAPLVFLSRIEPIKGTHLAIEACRRAGRKLIIAGNRSEKNDEEGRYWREIIKPQIDGRQIEYVGSVDDAQKEELLRNAAALIVPVQWEEPFGIVFIEALGCGTPVISCPRGALPEIVKPSVNGFLCSDVAGMVRAIQNLASIERAECRERAMTMFSAEVATSNYERLYKGIVQSNATGELGAGRQ